MGKSLAADCITCCSMDRLESIKTPKFRIMVLGRREWEAIVKVGSERNILT